MLKQNIRYHTALIDIIDNFKRPKNVNLFSKAIGLKGLTAQFHPDKTGFKTEFRYDLFSKKRSHLDIGEDYKSVEMKFLGASYICESMSLISHAPPIFTGLIRNIYTKGFSKNKQYYFQLVVPLEKELLFHYNIQQNVFTTDIGYRSRCGTMAILKNESFQICCISSTEKEFFVVFDSPKKQSFKEFSEKANAIKIGLGYLSGNYVGNQGYYFAYGTKLKKTPKHFKVVQMRSSIKSSYSPVYSNPFGYLSNKELANYYYDKLRPISVNEFSTLCEYIYDSTAFASVLVLILESSVASLLFMPGGYAIALESMSDLIKGKKKLKLAPIKEKKINNNLRSDIYDVLKKYISEISPGDMEVLKNRVNQINQATNKARLKAPFELLSIELKAEDLKILETRNDFLHGRVPDLTNSGPNRSSERINKDLYYASLRFYTLLNMLILKWIGYDNRVVNYPKIYEVNTGIIIDEEPYRMV
jgi:hypothetical protein